MIITFGGYWIPILLALAAVAYMWYWSTRVSHRAIEKFNREEPRRFNFSWRTRKRRP